MVQTWETQTVGEKCHFVHHMKWSGNKTRASAVTDRQLIASAITWPCGVNG